MQNKEKYKDEPMQIGREVDILPDTVQAEVPATDAQTLKGCVSYQGPAKTLQEMEAAGSASNRKNRNVGLVGDISEKMLEHIANSVPPAEAEAFNHGYKEE